MTIVSPHIMKVIVSERITDLQRDAVPRPEATPKAGANRRVRPSAKPAQTAPVVRAERR